MREGAKAIQFTMPFKTQHAAISFVYTYVVIARQRAKLFVVIMLIENRSYSIQIAKFSLRGAAPDPAGGGAGPRPLPLTDVGVTVSLIFRLVHG